MNLSAEEMHRKKMAEALFNMTAKPPETAETKVVSPSAAPGTPSEGKSALDMLSETLSNIRNVKVVQEQDKSEVRQEMLKGIQEYSSRSGKTYSVKDFLV